MMRSRTKKIMLAVVIGVPAAVVVLFALGNAAWRHQYPYGFSHCCDWTMIVGLPFSGTKPDWTTTAAECHKADIL